MFQNYILMACSLGKCNEAFIWVFFAEREYKAARYEASLEGNKAALEALPYVKEKLKVLRRYLRR